MNFIPYGKQSIDQNDIDAVIDTLTSAFLTTGPKVKEFEDIIRQYCECKYTVAVSNGTAALEIAYRTLGLKGFAITTPFSLGRRYNDRLTQPMVKRVNKTSGSGRHIIKAMWISGANK